MDSLFLQNFKRLLQSGQLVDALNFLKNPENRKDVDECLWDLVSSICALIVNCKEERSNLKENQVITLCERMLDSVVESCKAKEVLLACLEEADTCKNDLCFTVLLKPIQKALINVPGKRGKSLEWVLTSLNSYVAALPRPKDRNLVGKELLLLDFDPEVSRIVSILQCYIAFFEPFVVEVSCDLLCHREVSYIERVHIQRDILTRFLLCLLDHPMSYLDLTATEGKPKSSSRVCAEKVMNFISQLQGNLFKLYKDIDYCKRISSDDFDDASESNEASSNGSRNSLSEQSTQTSNISLGVLGYLLFCEEIEINKLPCVYTHQYVFETHLPLMTKMLSRNNSMLVYKGLTLSTHMFTRLNDGSLPSDMLDSGQPTTFCKILVNLMVRCPVDKYRMNALKLLEILLNKFDDLGRYKLIFFILYTESHAGVKGVAIAHYKNHMHKTLLANTKPNPFVGANLQSIMHYMIKIPDGAKTDLVLECDYIMASLNLLRYLYLRDKKEANATGIWNMTDKVNSDFLEPIRSGINLSRAHYEQRNKELAESSSQSKKKELPKTSVTVDGKSVPLNLEKDHEMHVINSAFRIFDIMESVLVRVEELVQA